MTTERSTIRIVLAEDHAMVRQGLKLLIDAQPDMTVIAEASDGTAAIREVIDRAPDVLVMDLSMPGTNGLIATQTLLRDRPDVKILVLTRHADDAYLQEILRAGACGYVLKQSPSAELLHAIRAVAGGRQYLDPGITARVTALFDRAAKRAGGTVPPITEREAEVLRLIALGHSNKEIAAQLALSVKTVEVHKANAMRKLGLGGRIDIVRYAVLRGWLRDT